MAGFSRALIPLLMFAFCLLSITDARELLVGGKTDAWKIPTSELDSLNKWAQHSRFVIGDTLVWNYNSKKDSVLLVSREAYLSCNTTNPIEKYEDGDTTKVKLERSGPYYFISGEEGHCEKGQKVIVVVLSERYKRSTSLSGVFSPAPSPSEIVESPAVAPTSTAASRFHGSLILATLGVLFWSFIL